MIFFSFIRNEFFRKLNKSVLDSRKVERTSKASVLFQYICCIRDFTGNCLFPKNRPTVLAMVLMQYSTNLEVWKADHSLALRFRIPLRPDQSRHTTERTNKQSLNSELLNIPKFLDFSSQGLGRVNRVFRPVFISHIFCFRDFSSKRRWNGWRNPSYQFY